VEAGIQPPQNRRGYVDKPSTGCGWFKLSARRSTASFLAGLERSAWFRPTIYPDQASAEQALLHGRADAVLWLRSDFTRLSYSSGGAPIDLTVNGVDANQARIIENYVNGTWLLWLQ